MKNDLRTREAMILLGFDPRVGFLTNSETKERSTFIEVNGEKIVCIAKGGECRHNPDYYSIGLRDERSWTTPIIDEKCPDKCPYKYLVCDDHPEDKCDHPVTYYPQYNKFRGQFGRYCKTFKRLENGT